MFIVVDSLFVFLYSPCTFFAAVAAAAAMSVEVVVVIVLAFSIPYIICHFNLLERGAHSTAHFRFGSFQVGNVCFHFYVSLHLSLSFTLCTMEKYIYSLYFIFRKDFHQPNCIQIIISH